MTSTDTFTPPAATPATGVHHGHAAATNAGVSTEALAELLRVLDGTVATERILLEAAAGAGKSYSLRQMVAGSLAHPSCARVAVVAFTNRQIIPLARDLGAQLGADRVCLRISAEKEAMVDTATRTACTVATAWKDVPADAAVVITTSHSYKRGLGNADNVLGRSPHDEDRIFDVVFVDEAWQLAAHLYRNVAKLGRVVVGVGDVGQLPPFDRSSNPYRGDPGYNPTRAWPTAYATDDATWSRKMPAVWRPRAEQLGLWRRFYSEWGDALDCVAAPEDREVLLSVPGPIGGLWAQVATGVPTLAEVEGLDDPEAADIDLPLLAAVEGWLDALLTARPELTTTRYAADGTPSSTDTWSLEDPGEDALIAVLATRNGLVEEAEDMVARLTEAHDLEEGVLVASTVDSYQGQTNALTIAIHPLSGATELDAFNSEFGRLAVVCTRATHGLLLVSRPGLDDLLADAPARPGRPLGEPGTRELPRQTHRRILSTFARGRVLG